MHFYVFGSLCRGEVDLASDIDVLAIAEAFDCGLDPDTFSIYSYHRIRELWRQGNPFAWHLATDAKLIFASNSRNFLAELSAPAPYKTCAQDCQKFLRLYQGAITALKSRDCSRVFELSVVFLAVRNFATCFSLGVVKKPNFSRHVAKQMGAYSLNTSDTAYELLERSRILSTRAHGTMVQHEELKACFAEICEIECWMKRLLPETALPPKIWTQFDGSGTSRQ